MEQKSIIIIGAGVAGLCAGIYGQMNGYQTCIVESQKIPGGLVTAWKRKGFLIDLCVHWLAGSGPGIHLNRYWNEIGLLEGRKFYQPDRYAVFHGKDGRVFNLYSNPDRLEQHMLDLSPQDADAIREFIAGVRFGYKFNPPHLERYEAGTLGWAKIIIGMLPLLKDLQKWQNLTMGELASKFKDPLLRLGIMKMYRPEFSVLYSLTTLGFLEKKQGGYPLGGSLPFALFLEKRYKQLGGQVKYSARVKQILVENSSAVGVQFEDGGEQRADVVISAADGRETIFEMLQGKFTGSEVRDRYKNWKPFPSMIFAGVGANRTFPDSPFSVEGTTYELPRPVDFSGKAHTDLHIRLLNLEPGFAPAGKTVLTSTIDCDYEFWKALAADPVAYVAEKERISKSLIAALEQIWPGISAQVEMCDIATPITFERFTGNFHGSITGWELTPRQGGAVIAKSLPGLKNFWMAGQWVYPGGGLPGGVSTAREVIWRQCRNDRKQFVTYTDK
jgi:phytoene dehydrogenase-like protein